MIKKIKIEYYVLSALVCGGQSLISAMYVLYLISHNLNLFEVNLVNVAFFTTLFIAEIPTGAFADVFGRKLSFIVACLLSSIGMFVYGLSDSFGAFVIAEIIAAVGKTFASGAFRAWFVDKLLHHGYQGKFDRVFARANQIEHITQIVSAIAGAYLASISMRIPWFLGAGVILVAGVTALFFKEEYFVRQKYSFKKNVEALKQTVITSVNYGFKNQAIRFILLLVILQVLAVQATNMQWQPFFNKWVSDQNRLGFVYSAVSISLMIGAWIAPKILRKIKCQKRTLVFFQIMIGFAIVATALSGSFILAMSMFLLHEVFRGAFSPIKYSYLHENIPTNVRATIESFESMSHHFGGIIGLLLTGISAEKFGIPFTWIVIGLFLILSTGIVAKTKIHQSVVK